MQIHVLNSAIPRWVTDSNFNQHICSAHPDRIMHEHDLVYIREGRWIIEQDGIPYSVGPGDVILLHQGHHHGGPPSDCTVKTCFIHFTACPGDHLAPEPENQADTWQFPVVSHCGSDPMVEHYFQQVIYANWSDSPYFKQEAAAWLELLLCRLSWAAAVPNSLTQKIKLQIMKDPSRFISAEDLADQCHCSVRTVTAHFKNSTGMSLHAWQLQLKCRMAENLLQTDPSISLKEIAATYGFCDEYHFGKIYKKHTGHSPKRKR